jgi:hypothetical protein
VILNQNNLKRFALKIDFSLTLTPGVVAAAVDFKNTTAICNAVLFA